MDGREHGFFLAKKIRTDDARNKLDADDSGGDIGYKWEIGSLKDFETGFFDDADETDRYVAFVDPSNYPEYPSWPLRNLLVLVRQRFRLTNVQILCYRDVQSRRHEARSIVLPLSMDRADELVTTIIPRVTGWERNLNGELRARIANLGEYMDPARLADQAVDLNLKLMKWRISPNLDLDAVKDTRCLLLGAGTLGSYVSRNLMGWGVRKITFVDYGSVSFSNPVRQPLFEFEDCLGGGKPKALRAAEALKQIYPGVESEGHVISVPMLGHPVTDRAKAKADFEKLEQLIDQHDAIFLLMDSRESRWLPSLMGKAKGKIVMNAALGFDTYLVMRHGAAPIDGTEETLGCYFCNDVVVAADVRLIKKKNNPALSLFSPLLFCSSELCPRIDHCTNQIIQSMKDQTLDQQCTVTRPGVAAIASALLVELLTSLLQHPQKHHAPAPTIRNGGKNEGNSSSSGPTTYDRDPPDHALGIIPHQIRGFLNTFQNLVIHGRSFPQCSACSKPVIQAYSTDGWEFVLKALDDRDHVAELSGLAEVQRRAEAAAQDVEWSEEEGGADEEGEEGVLL